MNREKLIEFSWGRDFLLGVGICLGLEKAKNYIPNVYVLLGDGECDEGSIWEAVRAASYYGLNRLVAVIDQNGLQYDGMTVEVMGLGSVENCKILDEA